MPEIAFIDFLVFATVVMLTFGLVTKVIIPLIFGRPVFPIFRHRQKVRELEQANDQMDEVALEQQIRESRNRAERMRQPAPVVRMADRPTGEDELVGDDEGPSKIQ